LSWKSLSSIKTISLASAVFFVDKDLKTRFLSGNYLADFGFFYCYGTEYKNPTEIEP